MKELISISHADRRFFRVGLIGGIILLTFFILQSIGGKFGLQVAATWGMILLLLAPVTITVVVLQFIKTPTRKVNRAFFRLIYGLYVFYLLAIFAVWMYQPFIGPSPDHNPQDLSPGLYDALVQASYALIPVQLILIGLLIGFNLRKGPAADIEPEGAIGEDEPPSPAPASADLHAVFAPIHTELVTELMEGDIDGFFEKFNRFCQENQLQFEHIAVIQNRWRRNRRERDAGTVSTEEYDRGNARTLQALINFMDEVKP